MNNTERNEVSVRKGFTLRQRLAPTILVAVALGLTLCIIGPYDVFFNNVDEFLFSGKDFALWNILYCIALIGLVCGILLPLKGKWFDVTFAVIFAITLMLFVQGTYLNGGMNSLAGDGVGETVIPIGTQIVNCAIWLLMIGACVTTVLLLKADYHEWIGTVACLAMVVVIGMQMVPLLVSGLTLEPEQKSQVRGDAFLTFENLNEIGAEDNVFYFVIDRFDWSFYENYAKKEAPELFENLDGFTYYCDMVSYYPRTFPAIPYMLTGIAHDFEDSRVSYLNEAYEQSEFLHLMNDSGYDINIYTDYFYGYDNAGAMEDYISNSSSGDIEICVMNKMELSWDMVRLSLYRYLPLSAKSWVGTVNTPMFQKYIGYTSLYSKYASDMRDVYNFLQESNPALADVDKKFSFIHLEGCHIPNPYNEDFKPAVTSADKNSPTVSLKQSFKIINMYILKLKELGLYEDATIIISGDHASLRGSDTMLLDAPGKNGEAFLTALFVKPSGSAGTPLQVSNAPIAQADVIPTILKSEGIQTDKDFGRAVFDVAEDEERIRTSVFHSCQNSNDYEEIIYRIKGSGRDLNNWTVIECGKYVGDIYN